MKSVQLQTSAERDQTATEQRSLEKQLQKSQWQVQDITAMKDAKITELQAKFEHQEKATARMHEDFKRK